MGRSAGVRTPQLRGIRSASSRGVTWAHPGSHHHPEGSTKHGDQRRGVKRGCPGKVANMFLQPPPQRAAGTSFRQRCPGQMLISPPQAPLPDTLLGVKINIIFFRKEIIIGFNSKISVKAPRCCTNNNLHSHGFFGAKVSEALLNIN